eukprot:gnl/MRDRNA2_/MRDRNA2_32250_c0_seq1.p1 gnl/MRDRNA2_/MRDRNA2_32250_c0~~gnl/MRDRNA2_/MRDRNA2_32250_c0_seq1.p1  ORF type:complete len:304 (-),score=58.94 gnl/MRDRNA2_/MRDRNA2_32250_c0_seq1:55-966(-)
MTFWTWWNTPVCQNANLIISPGSHGYTETEQRTIVSQLISCGFAVISPGMLPQLTRTHLETMRAFGKDLVDIGVAKLDGEYFRAGDLRCDAHADGRYDLAIPFTSSGPFGLELVQCLTNLEGVLHQLFGHDVRLGFISMLHAVAGARGQRWHGEGPQPAEVHGSCCFSRSLKVHILLHDLEAEAGMIHLLNPTAAGKYRDDAEQETAFEDVMSKFVVVPKNLSAGSVILYHPKVMHSGGPNLSPHHKFILDVMLYEGNAGEDGDNTPERLREQAPAGYEHHKRYVSAWRDAWDSRRGVARSEL